MTSDTYFLPDDEFRETNSIDPSGRLPSRILATTRVPSLSCGEEQFSETYRLIGLSAFDIPPIAVSATLNNSVWSVRAVQLRDRGDLTTTIDTTRTLSNDEGLALAQAIRESRFWMTIEPNEAAPKGLRDGEMWIVEARRNASYQAVRRWTPREQPIKTLGVMLLKLSGLPHSLFPEDLPWLRLPSIPPPGSR